MSWMSLTNVNGHRHPDWWFKHLGDTPAFSNSGLIA
jgi:hypothetical protein